MKGRGTENKVNSWARYACKPRFSNMYLKSAEMKNTESVTVDSTIEHGTHATNVQWFVMRLWKNQWDLEHYIINGWDFDFLSE